MVVGRQHSKAQIKLVDRIFGFLTANAPRTMAPQPLYSVWVESAKDGTASISLTVLVHIHIALRSEENRVAMCRIIQLDRHHACSSSASATLCESRDTGRPAHWSPFDAISVFPSDSTQEDHATMTITARVHGELFAEIPTIVMSAPLAFSQNDEAPSTKLIRMPLHNPRVDTSIKAVIKNQRRRERRLQYRHPHLQQQQHQAKGLQWTTEEHERFLRGLELYPRGPWKKVATLVGTRTVRQTMTHAQKYREKIARHQRGLHPGCRSPPRAASNSATLSCSEDATSTASEIGVSDNEWIFAESNDTEKLSATASSRGCANSPLSDVSSSTDEGLLGVCLESLIATTLVIGNSSHECDFDDAATKLQWQEDQALEKTSFQFDDEAVDLDLSYLAAGVSFDNDTLDDCMLDQIMDDDTIRSVIEQCLESMDLDN